MGTVSLERSVTKIHLTDVCDENANWKKIYCDKIYPLRYFFFEKFRRCKFAAFCSYSHVLNEEKQLNLEVEN